MKILVTGGSGFIGSHVCRDLLQAGHDIAVLSRDPAPWRLAEIIAQITVIGGGFQEASRWREAVQAFRPDALAHLAWAGVANFERNNPEQVRNISWTADFLAQCRAAGAHIFLGLGSQAEYGPKADIIGPDDTTNPTTLYGEAKLAACRISAKLARALDMRFVWMRVFSTYGATDHPYWMIPSLISDLLQQKKPSLTAGDQLWDFLHVADAAHAIRLGLENPAAQDIYNLGSGRAPTLRSTIEMIRDAIDPALPLGFGEIAYRPDQVMRLQADVTKLRRDLGWTAEKDLRQGLAETVEWYRANRWIFSGDNSR